VIEIENRDKFLLFLFALMMAGSGFDISLDISHGASLEHVVKEAVLFVLSIFAMLWLIQGLRTQQKEIEGLRKSLQLATQTSKQPEKYVQEARKKLGDVISQQFKDWALSPSEREVGLLLLKGLSLKEIAAVRNTLEKTVRQQASSIYKKADVSGRHAFSAWFIEDIL